MRNISVEWDGKYLSVQAQFGWGGGYTTSRWWKFKSIAEMLDGDISEPGSGEIEYRREFNFPIEPQSSISYAESLLRALGREIVVRRGAECRSPQDLADLATAALRRELAREVTA